MLIAKIQWLAFSTFSPNKDMIQIWVLLWSDYYFPQKEFSVFVNSYRD